MQYEIKRTHRHRNTESHILEIVEADSLELAREAFTDYVAGVLADDTTGHYLYVRFIEQDGGYVDQALAYPQQSDILPELPAWYKGAGYYDESENLVLLYDSGIHKACDDDVDFLIIGDYRYELAAAPQEQAPPEQDDEAADDDKLTDEEHIRQLDELRREITKGKR